MEKVKKNMDRKMKAMQVTLAFLIVFVATGSAGNEPVKFNLIVPEVPVPEVPAPLGSSVTLPCAVSPTFSVVPLKIRWHRPELFKTPVLLYENNKMQQDPAGTGYRGRVSLVGGLEQGNVSMKLENIKQTDRGVYICFVQSKQWFEEAIVTLNTEVIGTVPLLSLSQGHNGQVNVTCMSDGWSPQPTLTWTSGRGEKIKAHGTVYTTDNQGLVRVSSWLLHPPSQNESVSCSIGLSDQERKEGRVVPFVYTDHKGALIGGIIGGLVLLILIPTAVLLYRKGSGKKKKKKEEGEENKNLMKMNHVTGETHLGPPETTVEEREKRMEVKDGKTLSMGKQNMTVPDQIEDTTTRLKRNQGVLMKLRRKIEDTLKLVKREAREPLNNLMRDLTELDKENVKQTGDIKELKKKMYEVKRNMDQKPEGIAEMARLQQNLDEINNSISDWEKKVEELRTQVAEKTKGLNKGKGGRG